MSEYYQLMKPFGPRIGHFVLNPDDFEKIRTPACLLYTSDAADE